MQFNRYWVAFVGIFSREVRRFIAQHTRLLSALVRPMLWLIVFANGFRAALGVSIMEPYGTYITYQTYITPGLCCMILLFNGMQSSLSMVYDREMGSMKVLLMSPLPRSYLLFCKLLANAILALIQVYLFLLLANVVNVNLDWEAYVSAMPAILVIALFLGALGLLLSNLIKQLENFAGVMNFVIFPMFFLSSALYPLWKMKEASLWLYWICQYNPFTTCVELLRWALYQQINPAAIMILLPLTIIVCVLAVLSFSPSKGQRGR